MKSETISPWVCIVSFVHQKSFLSEEFHTHKEIAIVRARHKALFCFMTWLKFTAWDKMVHK